MRAHLWISALALLALALPARAQTLGGGTTPGSISGLPGIGGGTLGTPNTFGRKRRFPTASSPGLYEIRLPMTPSGFAERFLLQIPRNAPSSPAPLLVAFHRFSNTMYDIPFNTDLCAEANARGWYLLAPMALTDINLNSVASQINVETVLELITRIYNIDDDRIYGVGHSMGGGCALSYAARHLDPSKPMFASVINHTGVMSQRHSYENDCNPPFNCGLQDDWEFWYGGEPSTNLFDYQRSSLIDIPYVPGFPTVPVPDQTSDMARNLTHIPMQSWMAQFDPLPELVVQNYAFEAQMLLRGGQHTLITLPISEHLWSTLDYTAACNFLSAQTLTLPTAAETLADQNGTFFHFGVTQTTPNQFTPFTWSSDTLTNTLSITETANLSILDVAAANAGLSARATQVLTVNVGTADGLPPLIRLNGLMTAPASVTRDGQPDTSWVYMGRLESLEFQDVDGNAHTWVFTF